MDPVEGHGGARAGSGDEATRCRGSPSGGFQRGWGGKIRQIAEHTTDKRRGAEGAEDTRDRGAGEHDLGRFQGCCVDRENRALGLDDAGRGKRMGSVKWASPCMVPTSSSQLPPILGPRLPTAVAPALSASVPSSHRHPISPSAPRLPSRISHLPFPIPWATTPSALQSPRARARAAPCVAYIIHCTYRSDSHAHMQPVPIPTIPPWPLCINVLAVLQVAWPASAARSSLPGPADQHCHFASARTRLVASRAGLSR